MQLRSSAIALGHNCGTIAVSSAIAFESTSVLSGTSALESTSALSRTIALDNILCDLVIKDLVYLMTLLLTVIVVTVMHFRAFLDLIDLA